MSIAKHYETGESLPEDIYLKLLAARTFRAGSLSLRQVSELCFAYFYFCCCLFLGEYHYCIIFNCETEFFCYVIFNSSIGFHSSFPCPYGIDKFALTYFCLLRSWISFCFRLYC